jgi:type I restriction enzyme M protein
MNSPIPILHTPQIHPIGCSHPHSGHTKLNFCLRKTPARQPANLLRRADCLRILVPWRAFGDLAKCKELIPTHEKELIAEVERERDAALADIETA